MWGDIEVGRHNRSRYSGLLQTPSFSSRNDRSWRLAVLPLLPQRPEVEELRLARGILVTYEAIRKWCRKFGQAYANEFRQR